MKAVRIDPPECTFRSPTNLSNVRRGQAVKKGRAAPPTLVNLPVGTWRNARRGQPVLTVG
jgi:hypothetical protein